MKPLSLISSDQNQIYGFCQVGTSGTVTEFIVRKLKKFFCEMYEKKNKKTADTNKSIKEVRYNIYCQWNRRILFAMLLPRSNVLK